MIDPTWKKTAPCESIIFSGRCYENRAEVGISGYPAEESSSGLLVKILDKKSRSNWVYKDLNLLGVSPNSYFWRYLLKSHKTPKLGFHEFKVGFKLNQKLNPQIQRIEYLFIDSYVKINNREHLGNFTTKNLKGMERFLIEGLEIKLPHQEKSLKRDACINLQSEIFVGIKYYSIMKNKLFKLLCGNSNGCLESNSNIKAVEPISILIQGEGELKIHFLIKPEEFIYFVKKGGQKIADFRLGEAEDICLDGESDIGLGKLFFTKAELIIRARKGYSEGEVRFMVGLEDTQTLEELEEEDKEKKRALRESFELIGFWFCLSFFIVSCFSFCCKPRKLEKEIVTYQGLSMVEDSS